MLRVNRWLGCLFCGLLCVGQTVHAQSTPPGTPSSSGTSGNLTIQENVAQSFRIEPVVQRFSARRGELVPFEFQLTSLGKQTQVEVIPVNLRQELTGIILPDTESPISKGIKLLTATEFELKEGASATLKGELTVPATKTNFLSYGILVREKIIQAEFKPAATPGKTQASVKFITQYLLRIDIETEQVSDDELKQLMLEKPNLNSVDGLPMFQTILVNPTDCAFECRVAATLKTGNTAAKRPVNLVMGTRAGLEGDERTLVKIMPHSKLVLSAPPETTVTPGDAALIMSVVNGRREVVRAEKALQVSLDQFPVLQTKFTTLGNNMFASPAAIVLGQGRGERHTMPLTIANYGSEKRSLKLSAVDLKGEPLESLLLSSTTLDIAPGKNQNIRVSFKSKKGLTNTLHGFLRVMAADQEIAMIPVTIAYGHLAPADIETTPLVLNTQSSNPRFYLQVTNRSAGFTPLHGRLEFFDSLGRTHVAQDGYGKVLRPGETIDLIFPITTELPPGDLATKLSLQTFPGQPATITNKAFLIQEKN